MKNKQFLWLIFSLIILPGCYSYNIAETTAPAALYSAPNPADTDLAIRAGSVLLLRSKYKDGMVQARYHDDPTWYWMADSDLSPIPNVNPKSYNQLYASLETANPAGVKANTAYDVTIQTGPRGGKYYINKNGKKTYVKRSTSSGSTRSVGGKGSRGGKH